MKKEKKETNKLEQENTRLKIFIIIFMAITICLGTFYFNVVCFGAGCENKSPRPLIVVNPSKTNNDVEKTGEDTTVSVLPEGAEYLRSTSERIKMNVAEDYYEYIDVNVENGELVAKTSKYLRGDKEELDTSYVSTTKNYSISNEKVKYIYSLYYQSAQSNTIYVLCESGNVYVNNFTANNQNIDVLNNFIKAKNSDVSELVKVPTNHDYDNAPDAMPYQIDGLSNGNLTRIETANN